MYWGICNPLGINKWVACISALSLNVGAYSAETIRAAILSINKGQWEAGYSLGMSYQQTFRRIIIPQAATVSIPPLFNTFIGLVKDTSLASTIMIGEMFRKSTGSRSKLTRIPLDLYRSCTHLPSFLYAVDRTAEMD